MLLFNSRLTSIPALSFAACHFIKKIIRIFNFDFLFGIYFLMTRCCLAVIAFVFFFLLRKWLSRISRTCYKKVIGHKFVWLVSFFFEEVKRRLGMPVEKKYLLFSHCLRRYLFCHCFYFFSFSSFCRKTLKCFPQVVHQVYSTLQTYFAMDI